MLMGAVSTSPVHSEDLPMQRTSRLLIPQSWDTLMSDAIKYELVLTL